MVSCLNSSLCSFIHDTARLVRPPRQEVTQAEAHRQPAVFRRPVSQSGYCTGWRNQSNWRESVCLLCYVMIMNMNVWMNSSLKHEWWIMSNEKVIVIRCKIVKPRVTVQKEWFLKSQIGGLVILAGKPWDVLYTHFLWRRRSHGEEYECGRRLSNILIWI